MVEVERSEAAFSKAELPFAAPCRALTPLAPLGWLRQGAADMRAAPLASLTYGAGIALASLAVVAVALRFGTYWSVLILLSGFAFVGPLIAIGLYSISRHGALNERVSLRQAVSDVGRVLATTMVFSLGLLIVFLVWARAGSMLHVFYPDVQDGDWRRFSGFLAIGSAVGAIFAALIFAFSAFALPFITDRQCDAVTAIVTSVNAVLRNKRAMAVWAACIVAAVVLGFALGVVGLGVTIPLIGHATWHAYQETIDASAWPPHATAR
jgi:uncharacterized membrane protein